MSPEQRSALWQRRRWLLGLPLGGLLLFGLGMVGWIGVNATMEATNSLEFCTSCHEMQAFVYPEYEQSAHFRNAAGVRAVCADCHVPEALGPKIVRKVQATFKEVPGHFMGVIDTREEFEAHRPQMAKNVWARMRSNDSRNCRSCHSYEAMAQDMQGRSASKKHSAEWRERFDDTCIDCHFGIAHELPEGLTPADLASADGGQ